MSSYQAELGRARSARTQQKILDAMLELYARHHGQRPISAEDIMDAAQVSRGTFYRYYTSVIGVEAALGRHLSNTIEAEMQLLASSQTDPAGRAAIGIQTLMLRGAIDPIWGKFMSTSSLAIAGARLFDKVQANLVEGSAQGVFHLASINVALDFCIGCAVEGLRALSSGRSAPFDYIVALSGMVIRGLGVERTEAERISIEAGRRLRVFGPRYLPWWDKAASIC